MEEKSLNHPVLLFDGNCNLCRAIVRWIAQHDQRGIVHFAALQSEAGKQLLAQHGLPPDYDSSAVLCEDGRTYLQSDSVMRTLRYLRPPWQHAGKMGSRIPKVVRNWGYSCVSRNRSIISRAAGTIDQRWVPPPHMRHRFLDYPAKADETWGI